MTSSPAATGTPREQLEQSALAAATRAADAAEVEVRVLDAQADLEEAVELVNATWPAEVSISLLRALRTSGNFVSGARRGRALVGASIGFFGPTGVSSLHSHLAVADPRARTTGVGTALKLHQRWWALRLGVERVYWTYDPLVRRNAHVNLNKLAAVPVAYHEDLYGEHGDGPGLAFPTDRLKVEWRLAAEPVTAAAAGRYDAPDLAVLRHAGAVVVLEPDAAGRPREHAADGAAVTLVGTPRDVLALRRSDPSLARAWLMGVRDRLGSALAAGAQVTGITREGFYVLRHRIPPGTGLAGPQPTTPEARK